MTTNAASSERSSGQSYRDREVYRRYGAYDHRVQMAHEREQRARARAQPPGPASDPCLYIDRAFGACVNANRDSISACQFYYDSLHQQQTVSMQTTPTDPCASDLTTFGDCIRTNGDDVGRCQYYFDKMQECWRRGASS